MTARYEATCTRCGYQRVRDTKPRAKADLDRHRCSAKWGAPSEWRGDLPPAFRADFVVTAATTKESLKESLQLLAATHGAEVAYVEWSKPWSDNNGYTWISAECINPRTVVS